MTIPAAGEACFLGVAEVGIRYLPYSELREHCEPMARFGSGLKPLLGISQLL